MKGGKEDEVFAQTILRRRGEESEWQTGETPRICLLMSTGCQDNHYPDSFDLILFIARNFLPFKSTSTEYFVCVL